jgi:hypothetical protein
MTYIIAYLVAGLLISFGHPELRKSLVETIGDKEQGFLVKALILVVLLLISMLLWPVVLIFRRRNSAVEDARLNELKQHLVARGRKITESDGVLMTYRRVVEKQFLKVAKERREHLPEASLREISLHYVDAWVEANEERLGIAMPFLINGGAGQLQERGAQGPAR